MTIAQLVGTVTGLLVVLLLSAGIITGMVWVARRRNQQYERLDPDFLGAPVAEGVVVDRTYMWREVRLNRKYHITYLVRTPEGNEFTGWEVKWLGRDGKHHYFRQNARHRVAYRPGVSDEVRSLPPSQNPGWHYRAPRR